MQVHTVYKRPYIHAFDVPLQRYPGSPQSPRMWTLHQGTLCTSPAELKATPNHRSSGSGTSETLAVMALSNTHHLPSASIQHSVKTITKDSIG